MARRFSRELSNRLVSSSGSTSTESRDRAGIHRADLLDFIAAEIHNEPVLAAKIRFARRANFDFIAVQDVAPGSSRNIQFAVAGAL